MKGKKKPCYSREKCSTLPSDLVIFLLGLFDVVMLVNMLFRYRRDQCSTTG